MFYSNEETRYPERPGALTGGAAAALIGLLAAGLEGYFWIRIYNKLTGLLPSEATADAEAQRSMSLYSGFLIAIVIISVLISLAVVAGALAAMRGVNGGRIAMWIAGGLAIAWHLCCSGYTLFIRALFTRAVSEANADSHGGNDLDVEKHFPVWMVDAAVITGFAVGIASIAAVVLISLGGVNRYFRAMRQPPILPTAPGQW